MFALSQASAALKSAMRFFGANYFRPAPTGAYIYLIVNGRIQRRSYVGPAMLAHWEEADAA